MFLIVSGVSGSGKQTIIDYICQKYQNAKHFKSCTTRPRRENEDLYHYLTTEQFLDYKKAGKFFECEEVHGFYYGVLNETIDQIINQKDVIFLKDVDVHGAEKLYNHLLGKANVKRLFVEVPDEILYERLLKRGESPERAKTRLKRGKLEREYKKDYNYVIENLDLGKTFEEVDKMLIDMAGEDKKILKLRKNK